MARRFDEVRQLERDLLAGTDGQVVSADELAFHPAGDVLAFTGGVRERPESNPVPRICLAGASGDVPPRVLTSGRGRERAPAWSPDGQRLAFLSTRPGGIRHQAFVLPADGHGEPECVAEIPGSVEAVAWSPDGTRLLLLGADDDADRAGSAGSGRVVADAPDGDSEEVPAWAPTVISGALTTGWRRLHVVAAGTTAVASSSPDGLNVWEAVWLDDARVVAVVSDQPAETHWYTASLAVLDVQTWQAATLHTPKSQVSGLSVSPERTRIAFVEAFCSDRGVVAGDLHIAAADGSGLLTCDTRDVDVSQVHWLDETTLIALGVRGLDTVAVQVTLGGGQASAADVWVTSDGVGGFLPSATVRTDGALAVAVDGWSRPPEITVVRAGEALATTRLAANPLASTFGTCEPVTWTSRDGIELQGLLVTPTTPGPHPLVWNVHGGPVWCWRNRWHMGSPLAPLLVKHGYAVLHANPRGSSGRGQAFAELVRHDAGGEETYDHLTGVDALVERGIADPSRLAVMGGSHGGYLTCWLVTQTDRFAAAVAIAPVSNLVSSHYTSNIAYLDELLVQSGPPKPGDRMSTRSPILFADRVRTPTLLIAGAHDDCTPPGQAVEFQRALADAGVPSEAVIYPQEGHGIAGRNAATDSYARILDWLEEHVRPGS